MGGCRCTFRDCTNNTVNSPGKHFFHFPYKDDDRCKKWAVCSDKLSFLQLPWTQLRNKTVCEDHFIQSSFMNFKKERLVKTAIPTLNRSKDGIIHEFELDDSMLASLVYCFNGKGAHQKTIDLPDSHPQKRTFHVSLAVNEHPSADEELIDTIVLNEANTSDPLAHNKSTHNSNILNDTKPIVLNRVVRKTVKKFSLRNVPNEDTTSKRTEYTSDENEAVFIPNKKVKKEPSDKIASVGRTYGKSNTSNTIAPVDFQELERTSPTMDNGVSDVMTADILEKINHIEERDANKVDKALYMQMMTEHTKQIDDLKKLLTEKLADKKDASNQGYTSASSSTDARLIRVEKGPAMTKVQLFNGIRKYLNPTMVALLRMEMFGSSEREYRADEKQLSKELYNLNQNVYDYMRDEWRFRLPPKADVEEWLKNSDDDETWELC